MQTKITLYGVGYTRSARCRWTLQELGLEFEEIDSGALIGGDELRAYHPHAKVPAIVIDGGRLFESAAPEFFRGGGACFIFHLCLFRTNNFCSKSPRAKLRKVG